MTAAVGRSRVQSIGLRLPGDLANPVSVTSGAASLSFRLQGASWPGSVAGSSATYGSVLPATSVRYDSVPAGLKESLILGSRSAPASFVYALTLSSGLAAQKTAAGAIEVRDATGNLVFSIAAPFMR